VGYRIGTLYPILHRQDRAMPIFYSIFSLLSFRIQPRLLAYGDSIRFYFCVLLPLRGGWLRGGWLSWYGLSSATVLGRDRAMPIVDYILLSSFFPLITLLPLVSNRDFWPTEIRFDFFFVLLPSRGGWLSYWCGVGYACTLCSIDTVVVSDGVGQGSCDTDCRLYSLSFLSLSFHLLRKGS